MKPGIRVNLCASAEWRDVTARLEFEQLRPGVHPTGEGDVDIEAVARHDGAFDVSGEAGGIARDLKPAGG
jgi:hypothetical protein